MQYDKVHIFEENMSVIVVLHVYVQSRNLNKSFRMKSYKERSMIPYWISCVYRFGNNNLYLLSEYWLKVISVHLY